MSASKIENKHPLHELAQRHDAFMSIVRLEHPLEYYRSNDYADDERAYIEGALDDNDIVALFYGYFSTEWDPYAQNWMRKSRRGPSYYIKRMHEAFAVKYHLLKEYVENMKRDWPDTYENAVSNCKPLIEEHFIQRSKSYIPPVPKALHVQEE